MRKLWLLALVLAVYGLHQDIWNWPEYRPLLFGFLPIGLAYHAVYCLASALLMWVLIRFAWPAALDEIENKQSARRGPHSEP